MKNAIIFIIALAVSNLALAESSAQIHGKYAAPFGLEWGMSEEQVTLMGVKLTLYDSELGVYGAAVLPKNVSDVTGYKLYFDQLFGLIGVAAYTGPLDILKGEERYDQLTRTLVNKYGKPSIDTDSLSSVRTKTLDWGSAIDGTITLKRRTDEEVRIDLTYRSGALSIAAERKRERESRQRKEQTVPDADAL